MTGIRTWKMILLIPLLVGCKKGKENIMEITEAEAATLIEQQLTQECPSSITDIAAGVSFNTLTRVPGNQKEDKWVTLPDRDIITLPADAAEARKSQIKVMVEQGMLEKVADTIYLGRGKISGYYHKPVDYLKGEKKGEWTFEDKGSQYRLTEKGGELINPKRRPTLAFCLGKVTLRQTIIYRQPEVYQDKVKVVFTTTIDQTPEWITQKATREAFPYVIQNWTRLKAPTRYKTYIKIVNGRYVIENDQLIRLE